MSKYLIRPHHMLCMQFFEGKGYSDGFVASMAAIKEKLEKEDPQVEIVEGTDDVCNMRLDLIFAIAKPLNEKVTASTY